MTTPEHTLKLDGDFPVSVCEWSLACYEQAKSKGWWEKPGERNPGSMIFLMVTELAEAFEEFRKPDMETSTIYYGKSADPENHPDIRKPEGIPIEIADVAIRIMDYVRMLSETCGGDAAIAVSAHDAMLDYITLGSADDAKKAADQYVSDDFGQAMMDALPMLLMAYNSLAMAPQEHPARRSRRAIRCMMGALVYCFKVGDKFGFGLPEAIKMKHEFNATRSYRHGNKKA